MKRGLLVFLVFFTSCFADEHAWMDAQINEDLSYLSSHPTTAQELEAFFNKAKGGNECLLYCKIRNNKITWTPILSKDHAKMGALIRIDALRSYFRKLQKNYHFPDTDFIITLEDGITTDLPVPLLTFSKRGRPQNACLIPDFEMLAEVQHYDDWIVKCQRYAKSYQWDQKKELVFFRGATTGAFDFSLPDYGNERVRAVLLSQQYPELIDAAFNQIFHDPIRELVNSFNKPVKFVPIVYHFKYKYLLDIDGNASTYSRCRWILLSNSTLLKVHSECTQWYYKALEEWVHYVPVKQDFSDFVERVHYLKEHDDIAYAIACQGQAFGRKVFSRPMVSLYIKKFLENYSKYLSA